MWNLTEEKVEELQKLLKDKKMQYEKLQAMHIYTIWQNDLDEFLKALDEYEAKEEADRLAHGGVKNEGKKRRAAPRKKAEETKKEVKKPATGGTGGQDNK